jgi:hypothetical protein
MGHCQVQRPLRALQAGRQPILKPVHPQARLCLRQLKLPPVAQVRLLVRPQVLRRAPAAPAQTMGSAVALDILDRPLVLVGGHAHIPIHIIHNVSSRFAAKVILKKKPC